MNSQWDTAGEVNYRSMAESFVMGSNGVALVFSLTEHESFVNCAGWITTIRRSVSEDIPVLLLGNKCDLPDKRAVSKEEIDEFTAGNNVLYFETSALTGHNVNKAFEELIRRMLPQSTFANEDSGKHEKQCKCKCTIL